ncbi:Dscam [Cordylochernes scorpioides]|uniref:Dscam n=1 Tax=Cordylochernes scorpioides TaxID=51811 RepID=A0ABY6JUJ6_9ARAC|nr:Dscam [Cordylochernes scorpioides]
MVYRWTLLSLQSWCCGFVTDLRMLVCGDGQEMASSFDVYFDRRCGTPPKIKPFQFSVNLALGKKESLACLLAEGDGPFHFTWTKDGTPLAPSDFVKFPQVDEETSILRIPSVRPDHVGNYTCSVSGVHGRDSFTAALVLNSRCPIYPERFIQKTW